MSDANARTPQEPDGRHGITEEYRDQDDEWLEYLDDYRERYGKEWEDIPHGFYDLLEDGRIFDVSRCMRDGCPRLLGKPVNEGWEQMLVTVPTNATASPDTAPLRTELEKTLNTYMAERGYRRVPFERIMEREPGDASRQGEGYWLDHDRGEYAYRKTLETDGSHPDYGGFVGLRYLAHTVVASRVIEFPFVDSGYVVEEGDAILEAFGLVNAGYEDDMICEFIQKEVGAFIAERLAPHFDQSIWKDERVLRQIPEDYHVAWMRELRGIDCYPETGPANTPASPMPETDGPRYGQTPSPPPETGFDPNDPWMLPIVDDATGLPAPDPGAAAPVQATDTAGPAMR